VRAKPRAGAVTAPKRTGDRGADQGLPFPAFAADVDVGNVAARAVLLDPKLPSALRVPLVGEAVPVDVADVPLAAGADEAVRHAWVLLAVLVDVLALGQRRAVDQQARPRGPALTGQLHVLGDEPLRELPGGDARARRGRVLVVRRRGELLERRQAQQP